MGLFIGIGTLGTDGTPFGPVGAVVSSGTVGAACRTHATVSRTANFRKFIFSAGC